MATRRSARKARRAIADASAHHDDSPIEDDAKESAPEEPEDSEPARSSAAPSSSSRRSSRRDSSDRGSSERGSSSRRSSSRRGQREAEEAPARGGSRRSSTRRRRSGGDEDGGRAGAAPSIGKDGKAAISCPNCSARYRIPEAILESKVTCTQCHRTFFPLASAGSRRKPADNSKPIIYGVVGIIAIILVAVIVNAVSGPPEKPIKAAELPPHIVTGNKAPEVVAAKAWAAAIGERDEFNAIRHSDMDAMQKKFDIDKKNLFTHNVGAAQSELGTKIMNVLFDHDDTMVFRYYRPTSGRIRDKEMVARQAGTIDMNLYPKDSKIHKESAQISLDYAWDPRDERFKVISWVVNKMARPAHLDASKVKKNTHKAHELIGKTNRREITFGGKKYEIAEAELVPLPHLETTKPADRKIIDQLILQLIDIHGSGMNFNRADIKLQAYGKAAVPRVLNKMYETKMTSQEDVLVVNRLCRCLRHITGERFGFNPKINAEQGANIGASEKERISSLKQWYAWWASYYDRENWKNIDSDENALLTTKEQEALKAKRKAAADAAKGKSKGKSKR